MASTIDVRASHDYDYSKNQSKLMTQVLSAEFSLNHHDIPNALHQYTVLALKHNLQPIKQRALDLALEYHDLDAALNMAIHWVVQEPQDVPALFYLAHTALLAHEYELAADTLDKILKIDENVDLERLLAGIFPESDEDRRDLQATLNTTKHKNNPSLLVLLAGLDTQSGLYEDALVKVNKALKKRPNVTGFIIMKANLLQALEKKDEALKWLNQATARYPNNLELLLFEIRYLIRQNQPQSALSRLKYLLKHWPKDEEALFMAGLTSIDLKMHDEAERYLVQLRHSEKYQNDAYFYLALNAERKQQFETAKAYYRLVDGNLYTVSRRNLINIYLAQNNVDDALRFLTQERVNHPHQASFLYQLQAEILVKYQQKQRALQLLDEAIKQLPEEPELLYSQVIILDPYEDRIKLERNLDLLLQLEPNSPTYLNAYAYTLALQNRRLDDARAFAERALEQAPDQASILDTLGYIAFLQNDFVVASKILAQAYQLSPNINIGIRYAKSLYVQGDFEQFYMLMHELMQKYPKHPELSQLEMLILPQETQEKTS